jgi:hypothetical protein
MTFGGWNESLYASTPINWHNISKTSNYWAVQLEEFSYEIGNKTHSITPNEIVVVDSGTSYVLMPSKDRSEFIRNIRA